jgi:hypothetical protein
VTGAIRHAEDRGDLDRVSELQRKLAELRSRRPDI